jgi:hypothetical protein
VDVFLEARRQNLIRSNTPKTDETADAGSGTVVIEVDAETTKLYIAVGERKSFSFRAI